jgi:hypothetical protein
MQARARAGENSQGQARNHHRRAGSALRLKWLMYDFTTKAWRAMKLVTNQLPRAPCKVGYYEGQAERQACAAIRPQTAATSL